MVYLEELDSPPGMLMLLPAHPASIIVCIVRSHPVVAAAPQLPAAVARFTIDDPDCALALVVRFTGVAQS